MHNNVLLLLDFPFLYCFVGNAVILQRLIKRCCHASSIHLWPPLLCGLGGHHKFFVLVFHNFAVDAFLILFAVGAMRKQVF